jgi:hypothetical protein
LRKWKWFQDDDAIRTKNNDCNSKDAKNRPTNKLREPNLCCVLNSKRLVIVEVAMGETIKVARLRKTSQQYQDLASILRQSPKVRELGLSVANQALVVVLDENGNVPKEPFQDLKRLVKFAKKWLG